MDALRWVNWRNGFLRVWLVVSLCWIVYVALALVEWSDVRPALRGERPALRGDLRETLDYLLLALLPPVLLLALGLVALWVLRGFRQRP
jgi:hypothetical protein